MNAGLCKYALNLTVRLLILYATLAPINWQGTLRTII